ncbi:MULTISPECIES: hypothetical protein [Pseudomonas]|uniref:Uncharacterized protein n=1 Tax=Pseudomonas quercus TaxID=2722792 RepID=A0ABX0Y933_9PSED|nr:MULTISPECIES: hypothetical protein [Pseudomonas]MBF7140897.1 hypothetical protein [Pseudomonas sp. LY10J]NJO99431.1 hypothetical protein [Pseudomonas quercus]
MRTSLLTAVLFASVAAPAAALSVHTLTETELREASARLADRAGSSQWQQLWSRTRAAGHFEPTGRQPRFTLPMREIPTAVRHTLVDPHQVQVKGQTRVHLRRDFSPQVTGTADGQVLTAVCLTIEWRGAPDSTRNARLEDAGLTFVGLHSTQPCE